MSEDFAVAPMVDAIRFARLTQPHLPALTLHCYRMLGSHHDAEDMIQETMLRAWQAFSTLEHAASLRAWLYRIATRVCLDAIARARPRALPGAMGPPVRGDAPLPAPVFEQTWIQPLPDGLATAAEKHPDAQYSARESVALAFIALLQLLPAQQRAALVLRDVMGFSALETAGMLETSEAAANGALQRARATLEKRRPRESTRRVAAAGIEELVATFLHAWDTADLDGVIACLGTSAKLSMPPFPMWCQGREEIKRFYARVVFREPRVGLFRAKATRANGAPAIALYERGESGYYPGSLNVLEIENGEIVEIVAFVTCDPALSFADFGLPMNPG